MMRVKKVDPPSAVGGLEGNNTEQEWIPAYARMTKAGRGALRQAQGPGYGGYRPSFPRRRESIETSCKEWIPAFARMTKGAGGF